MRLKELFGPRVEQSRPERLSESEEVEWAFPGPQLRAAVARSGVDVCLR